MKMKCKSLMIILLVILSFLNITIVFSTPTGPTVTYKSNTTKPDSAAALINYTGNSTQAGGHIITMNLNSDQKNSRWKAFVGNVTGTLVLQDADSWSIYDWSITTSLTGEVYATRSSDTITWSSIACATVINITTEEKAINHTSNPNDNLTTTFDGTDNVEFDVGTTTISADSCRTTNLYVNGSAPPDDDFEEVLLHDSTNMVYTSIIEQDEQGYNTDGTGKTYDFQILLPEIGLSTWSSSTAYYFYVELT